MNRIRKILLSTDLSPVSDKALEYAINFAKKDETVELVILYITGPDLDGSDKNHWEEKLEEVKGRYQAAVRSKVNCVVKSGGIANTIVNAQAEYGADLIMVGARRHGKIDESSVTMTSELVLEADCPVLVIPENAKSLSIKRIALALGKNEIDDSFALGILHDIARSFGADVHILTIDNDTAGHPDVKDQNKRILEYYLETLDYNYAFPKNSDIEQGITDYVNKKKIDMLAILPRNHAKKSKPSEGRLTKLLTLRTDVPLLSID